MRNYTTQMDAARRGIVTPELEIVAKKEKMPVDQLMGLVAEGKVAICANKKSHLSGSGGCGQHAAHQNHCQSGCFPGLQGL